MLEYFPYVNWLIIWKKHYFTGWKSKKRPLHLQRKQQACLEKTTGLFMLPAKIRQSLRGINKLVSEQIDSCLYNCLQILYLFFFFACGHSTNNFCWYLMFSASFSVDCRNELRSSWTKLEWSIQDHFCFCFFVVGSGVFFLMAASQMNYWLNGSGCLEWIIWCGPLIWVKGDTRRMWVFSSCSPFFFQLLCPLTGFQKHYKLPKWSFSFLLPGRFPFVE